MFELVRHGSPEYWQTIDLRRRVLRVPLGLDFSDEELKTEGGHHHLAMWDGSDLVACLVLVPLNSFEAKMRQVAVEPTHQDRGLGRQLVNEAERVAKERGFSQMVLNAREPVVGFYEKLGYAVEGKTFIEVGIPHRRMTKNL